MNSSVSDSNILPSSKWKKIWHPDDIPKINIFNWILTHGRILTRENLEKRGVSGPYRCALCKEAKETSSHLFLECPFTKVVWNSLLQDMNCRIEWPSSISDLLTRWSHCYTSSLANVGIW
jgi:hypothetical protein